jgi:ELWxxDGT repeat protein
MTTLPNSSSPDSLTNVNGTLFFTASDGVSGQELWKSDGTPAGTKLVKDIFTGSYDSNPANLANVNGTLFFAASDGVSGQELWKSDGTDAGTTVVKDGVHGPRYLTNVNGKLFFAAGSSDGFGLWQSDGTAAGTVPFGPSVGISGPPTNVNGTLFFAGYDGIHGNELWKSDGTVAGTIMIKDLYPGETTYYRPGSYPGYGSWVTVPNSSNPRSLTNLNGTLFFTASGNVWKSDGTDAGTVKVADTPMDGLTNVNGTLYFVGSDDLNGYELWKSNGTAAGTVRVMDIFPGPSRSYPGNFTNANGVLFFTATDGVHGFELWALNTAPAPSLGVSGFSATSTAGTAVSFTVTARNADDTTNTGYLGTIHFTSTDPQAVLPADYTFIAADHGVHTFTATLKTAGYQAITARDTQAPGMAGVGSSIRVNPAAASTMTIDGFPSIIAAGGWSSYVSVMVRDAYGNIASGYTGTVRFTSSDPKAVLPANYTFTAADAGIRLFFTVGLKTAGTQSITVADTLNSALTATQGGITVIAGAASQLVISAPSSVTSGAPFSLTLTVEDAFGNVVTGFTGTVRFTSTDRSATLPANYTFTAADRGVHTFTGLILRKKKAQTITITSPTSPITFLSGSVVEDVR